MTTPGTLQASNTAIPTTELTADLVVVGGGLSGVCAAIAAARHGCEVILVQNRPVLGGNASSEIGIGIVGASCANGRYDSRETGILEEVQLAARRFDPTGGPASLDFALWEAVEAEPQLTLLLNTHITDVITQGRTITTVSGEQQASEKKFIIHGRWFADCTGDGTIAARAGCRAMVGREAKSDFGEPDAQEVADNQTMGNSIYWRARDVGHPVEFVKPDWAYTYSEEDLALRPHPGDRFKVGFWWVETGGDIDDTIADNEAIRDELWKISFGLWDHVKNGGDHGAENYVLDHVGLLPGKRESRRIIGEYILREQDLLEQRVFDDAIAYGGWTMDLHYPGGMRDLSRKPNYHITHGLYTIPWRSLVAADCDNLLLGGRLISATNLAAGSARVMATCAVIGQGLGTGVGLAKDRDLSLKEVTNHASELQQRLLRDDAFIYRIAADDENDLSTSATLAASSEHEFGNVQNVIDGQQRNRPELRPDFIKDKKTNPPPEDGVFAQGSAWISASIEEDSQPWLRLTWDNPQNVTEIRPIFDSNLSFDITQSSRMRPGREGMPITLVRDYSLTAWRGNEQVWQECITDNRRRNPVWKLPAACGRIDRVELSVQKTWGSSYARVFALRCQQKGGDR